MAATSCTPDSSGFYLLLDKALQFTPNEVHTPDYSLSSLDWERLPQPMPEAPPLRRRFSDPSNSPDDVILTPHSF